VRGHFYEDKMAYLNPTIDDFKTYFFRDFPYGTDPAISILDQDIANSYQEVNVNVNPDLFANQENYSLGYLLLSAHFLVLNIRSSSQGISGQFSWNQNSKSVGSVSESFSIPQRILDNPEFAMLSKTNYGARFLQIILPQLSGQIFNAFGSTRP
jgi:hypothetical protein